MPQMSPLWWTTLMIMFIMSLMSMSMLSYYTLTFKKTPSTLIFNDYNQTQWKW